MLLLLWKNEYFVLLKFSLSLFEINYWLKDSPYWYLIEDSPF